MECLSTDHIDNTTIVYSRIKGIMYLAVVTGGDLKSDCAYNTVSMCVHVMLEGLGHF